MAFKKLNIFKLKKFDRIGTLVFNYNILYLTVCTPIPN